jgi:hypothetical protein
VRGALALFDPVILYSQLPVICHVNMPGPARLLTQHCGQRSLSDAGHHGIVGGVSQEYQTERKRPALGPRPQVVAQRLELRSATDVPRFFLKSLAAWRQVRSAP